MSRINSAAFDDPRVAAIEVTPMWAGDLPISDVDNALLLEGVPQEILPKAPSRAVAMRRAFDTVAPRGAKIDMLPKGLGVAMSLKDVSKLDLEELSKLQGCEVREASSYRSTLTAKISVQNVNGTEIESLSFSPDDHPMVPLLREVYSAKKEYYKASEDLSVWFSQAVIPACGGIGKRARGGVYYVPSYKRELLLQVARALESISRSHSIDRQVAGQSFPVYLLDHGGKLCLEPRASDDAAAMEIVVDGVIRDADAALDDIAAALEATDGKAPGKRALNTKRTECAKLEAEIANWEKVASVGLDLLRNRIEELRAAIGVAELAAEMADVKDA
ncbi:MAG: hypothetical protein EBR40_08510 [Proteobacteria bacterium]|jgi:hypothetical protein|nr:hypothetical protein [Pseudomonadota bacterium]